MRRFCGKNVRSLWVYIRKDCDYISTQIYVPIEHSQKACAQPSSILTVNPFLHADSSTRNNTKIPLFEYSFYPVSTAPNTKTMKLIF